MATPLWLTPSAGRRAADCAAAEVQEVARQVQWLSPSPGAAPAEGHTKPRVPRAIRAAEAAALAAEAAAQATMASQALLVAVQSQGTSTPKKPRKPKEPTSTQKHSAGVHNACGSAFSAGVVRKSVADTDHDVTGSAFPAEKVHEEKNSDTPTTTARTYAARGTKGTFQGKRPPKDPEKLKKFLRAKAIYEAERADLRNSKAPKHRRPTPIQEEYRAWQRTFARSTAAASRAQFTEAAAEWQKKKAKQVQEKYEL